MSMFWKLKSFLKDKLKREIEKKIEGEGGSFKIIHPELCTMRS